MTFDDVILIQWSLKPVLLHRSKLLIVGQGPAALFAGLSLAFLNWGVQCGI